MQPFRAQDDGGGGQQRGGAGGDRPHGGPPGGAPPLQQDAQQQEAAAAYYAAQQHAGYQQWLPAQFAAQFSLGAYQRTPNGATFYAPPMPASGGAEQQAAYMAAAMPMAVPLGMMPPQDAASLQGWGGIQMDAGQEHPRRGYGPGVRCAPFFVIFCGMRGGRAACQNSTQERGLFFTPPA